MVLRGGWRRDASAVRRGGKAAWPDAGPTAGREPPDGATVCWLPPQAAQQSRSRLTQFGLGPFDIGGVEAKRHLAISLREPSQISRTISTFSCDIAYSASPTAL